MCYGFSLQLGGDRKGLMSHIALIAVNALVAIVIGIAGIVFARRLGTRLAQRLPNRKLDQMLERSAAAQRSENTEVIRTAEQPTPDRSV